MGGSMCHFKSLFYNVLQCMFINLQWMFWNAVTYVLLSYTNLLSFLCIRLVVCFVTALVTVATDGAGTVTVEEEKGTFCAICCCCCYLECYLNTNCAYSLFQVCLLSQKGSQNLCNVYWPQKPCAFHTTHSHMVNVLMKSNPFILIYIKSSLIDYR